LNWIEAYGNACGTRSFAFNSWVGHFEGTAAKECLMIVHHSQFPKNTHTHTSHAHTSRHFYTQIS